mmetsp:Transcript_26323/g.43704  ORF Transcript_26323/g.43704 Transcript_26323/m.43704 type:complete len:254 (-) Transcript_26323:161-922(-)|eukprot:CAMPEP_0119305262 /NCGR_PEP_ID=MMETSP1333-20130426/6304_1 /TAXON_ID=418940 /ORGANISM="Scyphosphaera apsteinii, Strain RCC1455" /LENGTH=253 /DNA_ID=CAMNT_0007308317 /DNA_START=258 /DNA_END=1019 /DNA_ORIENTATION=-
MPPPLHVTIRKRQDLLCTNELVHEFQNLAITIIQLIACFGFFHKASQSFYVIACWIFFITSAWGAYQAFILLCDHSKYSANSRRGSRWPSASELGEKQRERLETVLLMVSAILFAVGSLAFLPPVSAMNKEFYLYWGTTFFLIGSLLLLGANYVNSLSISMTTVIIIQTPADVWLGPLALLLNLFGSCFFGIGSICFYPELEGDGTAWNVIDVGTWWYVWGAVLFVGAVLAHLVHIARKHTDKPSLDASDDLL